MRLWTLHPKYLDAKGLVALWREGLLAQKVLRGATRGYRHHPQLTRFRGHPQPLAAIGSYLNVVLEEAGQRGYNFDGTKIPKKSKARVLKETRGQLLHEWEHLKGKLKRRDPKRFAACADVAEPEPHPLFKIVAGGVQDWERV